MEVNAPIIESLIQNTVEYGQKSLELIKLKAIDKTSDVIATGISHAVVLIILTTFLLFLNLGLAFWLGEIFGKVYYGFFAIAAFYAILGILIHLFMHKRLKMMICNYIIKQVLE